jgi:hypothetical protein
VLRQPGGASSGWDSPGEWDEENNRHRHPLDLAGGAWPPGETCSSQTGHAREIAYPRRKVRPSRKAPAERRTRARQQAHPRRKASGRRALWPGASAWWPLLTMLAAQAALSARLASTAALSAGERSQLAMGKRELAHWVTGAPVPAFQLHAAGVPVLYPPLAAIADSVGGLAAMRALSLLFMLIATVALWSMTARLTGRRGAFLACAAWVTLGPAAQLGTIASPDTVSVCMLALALWCVTRAGTRQDETSWMLAAAGALVLANATSYVCVVFDPVVVGMAIATAWPAPGRKYAVMRGMSLLAYLTTTVILLLTADGSYEIGIRRSLQILLPGLRSHPEGRGWTLVWLVLGVAVLAGYAALKLEPHHQMLLALLLCGGSLLPLTEAGALTGPDIRTLAGIGTWTGVIAVGYAAETVIASFQFRPLRMALGSLGLVLLAIPAAQGTVYIHYPAGTADVSAAAPAPRSAAARQASTRAVSSRVLPARASWPSLLALPTSCLQQGITVDAAQARGHLAGRAARARSLPLERGHHGMRGGKRRRCGKGSR